MLNRSLFRLLFQRGGLRGLLGGDHTALDLLFVTRRAHWGLYGSAAAGDPWSVCRGGRRSLNSRPGDPLLWYSTVSSAV